MSTIKKYKNIRKKKTRKNIYNKLKPNIININNFSILLLPLKNSKTIKIEGLIYGGNIVENKNNAGISHLLEHALMESWEKCKKKHCAYFWEKYGTFSNAYTNDTYLHFWKQGLAENTKLILDYIVSIILHPQLSKKMIDKEKHAVRNELNTYLNNPNWKLKDVLYKHFYNIEGIQYSQDYSQQLKVLNTHNTISLTNYLKQKFNQKRILFVITGKFQKNKMIDLLKKKLKVNTVPKSICLNKCYSLQKKVLFIKNSKAKNTNIKILFPISLHRGDKDFPYLSILSNIIGGDFNSLLMTELRIKHELVYGATCSFFSDFCSSGCSIDISTLDKNIIKVLNIVFKIIKKYKQINIPNSKLLNVKNKHLINFYETSFNDVEKISSFFKFQFLFQLHKKNKKIYTYNQYANIIKNISQSKIQRLFKRLFNTEQCLIGYIGKTKVNFTEKDY
jgi:predicted Zn-dependent peptidase